jgi:hypothetical protein
MLENKTCTHVSPRTSFLGQDMHRKATFCWETCAKICLCARRHVVVSLICSECLQTRSRARSGKSAHAGIHVNTHEAGIQNTPSLLVHALGCLYAHCSNSWQGGLHVRVANVLSMHEMGMFACARELYKCKEQSSEEHVCACLFVCVRCVYLCLQGGHVVTRAAHGIQILMHIRD